MSFRVSRARRSWLTAALLVGVLLGTLSFAGRAQAYDAWPCDPTRWEPSVGRWVQNCAIWKSNTPVQSSARAGAPEVGYLTWAGSVNWFTHQCHGEVIWAYGYGHDKWALTMADNGQWGYVSEIYFSGGLNFEWDGGLKKKTTTYCYDY